MYILTFAVGTFILIKRKNNRVFVTFRFSVHNFASERVFCEVTVHFTLDLANFAVDGTPLCKTKLDARFYITSNTNLLDLITYSAPMHIVAIWSLL